MREMTGKPFTGFVVMWDEVPRLMLADYSGDPRARALIQVISNWLDMARALPRARAPLCMSCDAAFHGAVRPAAFAVLLPFVPQQARQLRPVSARSVPSTMVI
jgi:hypothetical protein